tara:strand:+ start:27590 stop:28165 length:576 start_codon:yes stop_codon:yes gene_type:complete
LKRIAVAEPKLSTREKEYVLDCIDTNWISSNGKYVEQFERGFARFCGVKHAIATNNGTTALHLALVGLGLQPGDEVIIPTVTYIATANAVHYCGATPVLVDVCAGTVNIDPDEIEKRLLREQKELSRYTSSAIRSIWMQSIPWLPGTDYGYSKMLRRRMVRKCMARTLGALAPAPHSVSMATRSLRQAKVA